MFLLSLIADYLLSGFGWIFWILAILSFLDIRFGYLVMSILIAVWKLKFWYWIFPGFFKWIADVGPSQEWHP